MPRKLREEYQIQDETDKLKTRLAETEETLRAIQQYMVDAFVVNHEDAVRVMTLNESEIPYHLMIESMNEGAVTLIPDGAIFYCNRHFAEMVGSDCVNLIGTPLQQLIVPEEQGYFATTLQAAAPHGVRGEFTLQTVEGNRLPVQLSLYKLGQSEMSGIAVLATNISERIETEEKIRALTSELTRAEQEERRRISQMLHDDLQQRLFAIKARLTFLKDVNLSADTYREIDAIQISLSEAIAITRNLSIDLSPVVLQGEGLAESIIWLAFRMKELYGLQVDVSVKEKPDYLDDHMQTLLFQAIREFLFNAVKHADVSQAQVTFARPQGHYRITVSDNGKGFDVKSVMSSPQVAHGLLIAQERLHLLGCKLELISRPGEGTRITIELPLAGKSR